MNEVVKLIVHECLAQARSDDTPTRVASRRIGSVDITHVQVIRDDRIVER